MGNNIVLRSFVYAGFRDVVGGCARKQDCSRRGETKPVMWLKAGCQRQTGRKEVLLLPGARSCRRRGIIELVLWLQVRRRIHF